MRAFSIILCLATAVLCAQQGPKKNIVPTHGPQESPASAAGSYKITEKKKDGTNYSYTESDDPLHNVDSRENKQPPAKRRRIYEK